jgi:hypothetical protein
MFLKDVAENPREAGRAAQLLPLARARQAEYPEIWHLFAYEPSATKHLERFTHVVMRGTRLSVPAFTN